MKLNKYINKIIDLALLNQVKHSNSNTIFDIIIPVYNANKELVKCINSLLEFTDLKHPIIIYDDASTDNSVVKYLDRIVDEHTNISVIYQPENIGYLQNVNQAILNSKRDVIVLNADTQVTKKWLEKLSMIAQEPQVAIVCPLSDNATILSLDKSVLGSIDALNHFTKKWYPLPTAVGSCMLIKRYIIEEFGVFDEYYDPGYGEECDYSLMLRKAGYEIACAPASFVFHYGSASFKESANKLKLQHQKLLDLRWPYYNKEIQDFSENNPIKYIEEFLHSHNKQNNILHIVHGIENKGGVELFTKELIERLPESINNTILIPNDKKSLGQHSEVIQYSENIRLIRYQYINRKPTTRIGMRNADLCQQELDIMFVRQLLSSKYKLIHFHSFVGLGSLIWPLICNYLKVPYIVSCHDHSPICFNFSMLTNNQTEFCNKNICDEKDVDCVKCLKSLTNFSSLTTADYIEQRNNIWNDIFLYSEKIIVPNNYLYSLFKKTKNVGSINKLIKVEPYFYPKNKIEIHSKPKGICIAFLGTFTHEKGAQIFIDAYKNTKLKNLKWQVIGKLHPEFKGQLSTTHIKTTGVYDRKNLKELLKNIDIIIIPSLHPETYSIVLTEAFINNIPVIASDIGATRQRIKHKQNGLLFEPGNVTSLVKAITDLSTDKQIFKEIQQNIRNSQFPQRSPGEIILEIYKPYLARPSQNIKITSTSNNQLERIKPNALEYMEKWLNSEMTLEAESDWLESPHIDIVILGNNSSLIDLTKKSCKTYAPNSRLLTFEGTPVINKISKTICVLQSGQSMNDNFGNWVNAFEKSKKLIGLSDYALINSTDEIYAPQFQVGFDLLSYQKRKHRIGALLYNTDNSDTIENITNFLNKNSPIHSLIDDALEKKDTSSIFYFPYLSYLFLDKIWAKNWKNETCKIQCNKLNKTTPISIIVLTNLHRDIYKSFHERLLLQTGIAIKHIYIFSPQNLGVWKDTSCHFIDFKEIDLYINPIIERVKTEQIVFINDNILLNDCKIFFKCSNLLGKYGIHAISPISNRNNGFVRSNKIGNGQIAGRGFLRDMRFDTGNLPTYSQLLDEDCFFISKTAWGKISGLQGISSTYYHSIRLSEKLYKHDLSIALLPISDLHKISLPSYSTFFQTKNLKTIRKNLIKNNNQFYLNSYFISKSYTSRELLELDQNFGTFKAPKNLPRVLAYSNDSWASGFYRVKAPISALAASDCISSAFLPEQKQNKTASYFEIAKQQPTILFLHNFFNDIQLHALKQYHEYLDCKIVLSLDDLLIEMPEYNSFKQSNPANIDNNIELALKYADRLIVSTGFLEQKFAHLHNDIHVINNFLPKELWQLPYLNTPENQKIRIGWAGAVQHSRDLDWIKPIIKATKGKVSWVFYGDHPYENQIDDIEFHKPTLLSSYHTKLNSLKLDIAIAPLIDNPFNQAKSHLKLIEYGALGIATICSNRENYKNSPAIKLENIPDLWIEKILNLAKNHKERKELGLNMYNWVHENYFLEDNLNHWKKAFFLNT